MYSYLVQHKKYLITFPLVIYWLILFILTTLPSSSAITIGVSDKIEHFGAYGLLSVLLYLSLYFQEKFVLLNKYPAAFTIIIAAFYGFLDEVHQLIVPGRSAEILDWLADFLGAVLGTLIIKYLLDKIKKSEIEKNKLNAGTF